MYSLMLVLESSLLTPLVEFATSSSGHVEPRRGLAMGWLGSVVAGLAVVFGAADRAQADPCYGIAANSSGSVNTGIPCEWRNHRPVTFWYDHYGHIHRQSNNDGCNYQFSTCGI